MKPVFVGGCPRSGTTMVGSLLAAAAHGLITPETHFKQRLLSRFRAQPSLVMTASDMRALLANEEELAFWDLTLGSIDLPAEITAANVRLIIEGIVRAYGVGKGHPASEVWVDHTPLNIKTTSLLRQFFPDAVYVHVLRDPRGVAASVLPLAWGPNDSEHFVGWWSDFVAHGLAAELNPKVRCVRVRYEDVVCDPGAAISAVCGALRLGFDKDGLQTPGYRSPAYSAKQHELVGLQPQAGRALAWQQELSPMTSWRIGRRLADLLHTFEYPVFQDVRPNLGFSATIAWWLHEWTAAVRGTFKRKRLRKSRRKMRARASR